MFTPKQYRTKAVEYGELGKISAGSNKRREFQKLEQSFTALADNEQWHEDNNHKTAHAPESHGPSGATLAAEEEHILRRLGAALMHWNTLPTKLRRELFDNADSMGELLETPALRGRVARFLHKHKDDEDYSSNMIRTEKTDASLHAAAVARWDDEGGASQAPEQQRKRKSKIPTSHAANR
jgi:hypothetical protein